ncbi:hypothetical protein VTN02DRAFT_6560 [Thermoascus thermophilus]
MLITPRSYILSQSPDRGFVPSTGNCHSRFHSLTGWRADLTQRRQAVEMLLVHQAGSVRVGEAVRYTLTYTPAADPILPTPDKLHVKIKNTSAIPLRAAYLHGPYTLYTACYPSTFDPNQKHEQNESEDMPQFEPNLKAGGNWNAVITVPQHIRQVPQSPPQDLVDSGSAQSVTWVIEIMSQVIFSTTAAVHFEVLVGHDEKSLNFGSGGGTSASGLPPPAQLHHHWMHRKKGERVLATSPAGGVYSKSITLIVDDTNSLWSTPAFPSLEEKESIGKEANKEIVDLKDPQNVQNDADGSKAAPAKEREEKRKKKKKRIHFVVLTHGLHSNLGADMLYLKESIDAAAKKAREQAKESRNRHKAGRQQSSTQTHEPIDPRPSSVFPDETHVSTQADMAHDDDDDEDEDEQVIVRGFPGNAVRTERGIQYLGKRLAKYVLLMTYPDQPCLPVKNSKAKTFSRSFAGLKGSPGSEAETHPSGKTIFHQDRQNEKDYAYRITSISFIGHSLGGLIQTYAIAYIQKHSPEFFERIKPINFIALATPFLGLSNENPIYVRFALDFGLVGRTGQDLGLSWTAPRLRNGWGSMIGGQGNESRKTQKQSDPGSKPLLRILPSGPAHQVLLKFRNRTVYSNVVNDGIVPLRTSCLLFLDWRGLDRVEKARRENGLVGTMAEWGWAELTGANSNSPRVARPATDASFHDSGEQSHSAGKRAPRAGVPQNVDESINDASSIEPVQSPASSQLFKKPIQSGSSDLAGESKSKENSSPPPSPRPFSNLFSFFRSKESKSPLNNKQAKIYKRSQTVNSSGNSAQLSPSDDSQPGRPGLVGGDSLYDDDENLYAPPRTTFFESAGDLLRPPLPPIEFIMDPSSRPRTIFHDRVYHPEDIPPPLPTKRRTVGFGSSHSSPSKSERESCLGSNQRSDQGKQHAAGSGSGMNVEEKIARAYHRDLSWRKVLVRLEPDAHNNIIVRRMFANAYGWPVVKHLVDTHFGYTLAAQTPDALQPNAERAKPINIRATKSGGEVEDQHTIPFQALYSRPLEGSHSETLEAKDHAPDLCSHDASMRPERFETANSSTDEDINRPPSSLGERSCTSKISRQDSARWSDRYFDDDNHESDSEDDSKDRIDGYSDHGLRGLTSVGQTPRASGRQASNSSVVLASPGTEHRRGVE